MSTQILVDADDYSDEIQSGGDFYINVDLEDYFDEIDTSDLIEELKERNDLPKQWHFLRKSDICNFSRTPKRDAIIDFLGLHTSANLEEIQNEIEQIYNQYK